MFILNLDKFNELYREFTVNSYHSLSQEVYALGPRFFHSHKGPLYPRKKNVHPQKEFSSPSGKVPSSSIYYPQKRLTLPNNDLTFPLRFFWA
jgi:hypothetical protein